MSIRGIDVILVETEQSGTDQLGNPIYTETEITVSNVLVYPAGSSDVLSSLDLYGKKAIYNLAIPKGDTNDWENKKVKFFDKTWKTFGFVTQGIEEMIPLSWNKQISVERYE